MHDEFFIKLVIKEKLDLSNKYKRLDEAEKSLSYRLESFHPITSAQLAQLLYATRYIGNASKLYHLRF